jgi:dTDP-4-amino-4,6-dideoxygalactose transaminase
LSAAFTGLAILAAGATPVFADVDPERLTLDAAAVSAAVTARTRAVLPVHLYGQPADMTALAAVAARHGLAIVEDCCQAHLATCDGRPVGTLGIAGAFSFYPTKNLGALGDGGAVITNDGSLAARLKRLRNGGQAARYDHTEPGINSRLDELQAAILRARLSFLRGWTDRRRAMAAAYRAALNGTSIAVPREYDAGHVYHLFVVRSPRRDALQAHLAAAGIGTLIHYPVAMTRQRAFAIAAPRECPIAERACREVLSLPLHMAMAETDVNEVADATAAFQ